MKETTVNTGLPESADTADSRRLSQRRDTKALKKAAKKAYLDQKKSVSDEQIVELLPLVNRIAHKIHSYLKPPLSFDDLVSAGTVGLVKAARDYDPSFQAEFKTYAYTRIKGAILDELRNLSLLPSNVNAQVRKVSSLSRQIYKDTGLLPTDDELAEKLGISLEKLFETFESARAQHFLSIEGLPDSPPLLGDFFTASDSGSPDKLTEQAELIDRLADAIRLLPEKQRQVITLYYHQQLTMKQIAEALDITEPRVSQIHASALFNLSVKLGKSENGK
jgi:RNA polymerase sigma factor for flagellar operon FliA